MPLIVLTHGDDADLSASSLTHDGVEYPGPLFDVPPDVAAVLTARPAFRLASLDESGMAEPAAKAPTSVRKPPAKKAAAAKAAE